MAFNRWTASSGRDPLVATRYAGVRAFIMRRSAMFPFCLFAVTGDVVARLDSVDGTSVQATIVLGNERQSREGHIVNGVMSVAVGVREPKGLEKVTRSRSVVVGYTVCL
jgi:hypothetical protein